MSKGPSNWALSQQHLPRGPFSVLRELCWLHTEDKGCFPSQDTLCKRTKYRRSTLNEHLKTLECAGLIQRHKRKGANGQQQSTVYTFPEYEKSPATRIIKEAKPVSRNSVDPCPDVGEPRVQNSDTKKDKFKTNSTSAHEPQVSSALFAASETDTLFGQRVIDALANIGMHCRGKYWSPQSATRHFIDLKREVGLSENQMIAEIVKLAKAFSTAPDGPKAYDGHLRKIAPNIRQETAGRTGTDRMSTTDFWVREMQKGAYVSPFAISSAMRDEIVMRGLLTDDIMEKYPYIFGRSCRQNGGA